MCDANGPGSSDSRVEDIHVKLYERASVRLMRYEVVRFERVRLCLTTAEAGRSRRPSQSA